jgi:hypothetical protein
MYGYDLKPPPLLIISLIRKACGNKFSLIYVRTLSDVIIAKQNCVYILIWYRLLYSDTRYGSVTAMELYRLISPCKPLGRLTSSRVKWLDTGIGEIIGFIEILKLVSAINYNANVNWHTVYNSPLHALVYSVCCIFTSRSQHRRFISFRCWTAPVLAGWRLSHN